MPDFVQNITIGISLFESLERLKDGRSDNVDQRTGNILKSLKKVWHS